MWRPDNWGSIKEQIYNDIGLDDPYYANKVHAGIEAGADAILEALKEDSFARRITLPAGSRSTNDLSDFELTTSGYLVFIPDEEQK